MNINRPFHGLSQLSSNKNAPKTQKAPKITKKLLAPSLAKPPTIKYHNEVFRDSL